MDTDLGTKKALILIDLQNEFLSPDGNFPIPHTSELLENISQLVGHFREHCREAPIVWVRAEYPPVHEDPSSAPRSPFNVLTGRHTGRKPCCYAGTSGAEFSPQVKALISETDVVVTKTWYSAFKETNLDHLLKEQGVTQLFVAGLLSNVCVTSTATEATNLAYRVHIVESCLGWKPVGGQTFTLDKAEFQSAQWSRAAKGYELKIYARNAGVVQLDGFKQDVRTVLWSTEQEEEEMLTRATGLRYDLKMLQSLVWCGI